MYGRVFEQMYEGSMIGAGMHVFAVWNYILTKVRDGYVEVNPKLLAFKLTGSEEGIKDVEQALWFLQQPDPNSRSKLEDGKRLVREGEFQYRVVNWEKYNDIKTDEERRISNRISQQKRREKQKNNSESVSPPRRKLTDQEILREAVG